LVSIPSEAGQGLGQTGEVLPAIVEPRFQSPQRRGKGWDIVSIVRDLKYGLVSIPSKAGQGLGLSCRPSNALPTGSRFNPLKGGARVGTQFDAIAKVLAQKFQSPQRRGKGWDETLVPADQDELTQVVFQSPQRRGKGWDSWAPRSRLARFEGVSIPSKAGQGLGQGERPPDRHRNSRVSIPSKAGQGLGPHGSR